MSRGMAPSGVDKLAYESNRVGWVGVPSSGDKRTSALPPSHGGAF
jgi:hypothetical protein